MFRNTKEPSSGGQQSASDPS